MSKYDALGNYLKEKGDSRITMTFEEVEKVLGFSLPKFLRKWEAGWYGSAAHSPQHVQKAAWEACGYTVEKVSMTDEIVTFTRMK